MYGCVYIYLFMLVFVQGPCYYALTLFKELGITNSQSAVTYEHCKDINHNTLLKNHCDDLFRYFRISFSEDSERLLSIYCLPKLNENSTKARFIISAPKCFVKSLSKYIASVFKLVFNQVNSYNKHCSYF